MGLELNFMITSPFRKTLLPVQGESERVARGGGGGGQGVDKKKTGW